MSKMEPLFPEDPAHKRLVLLYVPWCLFCRRLLDGDNAVWPIMERKYEGNPGISIMKVNCEASDIGQRLGIVSFPTILLLHQSRIYTYGSNGWSLGILFRGSRIIGDRSVDDLDRFLRYYDTYPSVRIPRVGQYQFQVGQDPQPVPIPEADDNPQPVPIPEDDDPNQFPFLGPMIPNQPLFFEDDDPQPVPIPGADDDPQSVPIPISNIPEAENEPKVNNDHPMVCKVCYEHQMITVCLDCGHMALCVACSRRIMMRGEGRCPICNRPVKAIKRVYY